MTVAEAWKNRRQHRHRADSFNSMEEVIYAAMQSCIEVEDVVQWKGKMGAFKAKFSTRDTWNHLCQTSNKVTKVHLRNTKVLIMCLACSPRQTLNRRKNAEVECTEYGDMCTLQQRLKNSRPPFFSCGYAAEVWESLAKGVLTTRYSCDWSNIIATISATCTGRLQSFLERYVFQATLYTIWKERNGRTHGEYLNPTALLIKWIDKQIPNRFSSISLLGDKRYDDGFQLWLHSKQ